jgi:ATP-dependent helicase HrpB
LPVEEVVDEVRRALAEPGHAVLVAPPGAGKTTVVPIRLLGEPWLGDRRIVVLEPRRLAARAAARRMAELLGEPVGRTVGYRTRDERVVGAATRIEVVTEGILVRRLQGDPSLECTGLVVLDEVHERNLVTDLSLAFLLDARQALCPDLRVLAMSATVAADRLAATIGGDGEPAPVVRSDGRQHPVAVRWWPPEPRDRPERHVGRVVAAALAAAPEGDVLVFLPGAAEIDRTAQALRGVGAGGAPVDVRPLHGRLPVADQDRALAPSPAGRRRVVLATDIAESSLTVAGVRIVVDAGLARSPRFDPGTGLTRLATSAASRAAADQRAGRAGRLAPGVAHRLWSEADHHRRPAFPEPEIAVVDLAGAALEVAAWGSDVAELPFPDQPPARAWAEALALLRELGALDVAGRPTATGRAMADLPLHPRLARLVVDGRRAGRGWEAVALAAVLDERDVLRGRRDERPADLAPRVAAVGAGAPLADADRDAVRAVARRAKDLARRADVRPGPVGAAEVGPLVALAHPDRIAQARGGGRFRLRGGGGGWLPAADPLAGAPFLAVADLDVGTGDGRIRTAAALDATDVRALVADEVEEVTTVAWDDGRDDLRRRTEVRAGAIVLDTAEGPATAGPATTAALLDRVRATAGGVLSWTDGARRLQQRLAFLHRHEPDRWPDVSDRALLDDLDTWLGPHLVGATGRRDLARVDVARCLRTRLGHALVGDLDRLAPEHVALGDGREVAVRYDDEAPSAAMRVQEAYGTTRHPAVLGGRVPVVLHLLSPAGRPLQVTADLPRFWAGSWAEVRKEVAGRYPKHDWPVDPATAPPGGRRRPRRS